jgi:hypothetical protein
MRYATAASWQSRFVLLLRTYGYQKVSVTSNPRLLAEKRTERNTKVEEFEGKEVELRSKLVA